MDAEDGLCDLRFERKRMGSAQPTSIGDDGDFEAAVSLASLPDPSSEIEAPGFLILHQVEGIVRLEGVDPKAAEVVRLRYFAGLSIEQTALALRLAAPTVHRTWAFARGSMKEAIESERV